MCTHQTGTGMARERVRWPSVVDRTREIVNGYAPMKVTLRQVFFVWFEGVSPLSLLGTAGAWPLRVRTDSGSRVPRS
ncbi:hypothetical protein GCM10010345_89950 [Streptomyces canarius]|uniref:Uncharacterized protein n=1 Tax=Streptomyces canarius TaxID=285453 RepID=A0ABQ3DBE5_9ACTN|nr:hypothetical protein GCM10010345_89950 [Streptomyces canarius]